MTLLVEGSPGTTSISVEEYKRPKFQVTLNAPADAAKLDAPVQLTGKATAYTGAAVGGAKVKWRVERDVQLPYWCWWWIAPPSKAISHGSAVTEADGTFKIDFAAEADRAVSAANEPAFEFSVHADVTDTTGETRSDDRAVWAGYTALAGVAGCRRVADAGQAVEFTVETEFARRRTAAGARAPLSLRAETTGGGRARAVSANASVEL